MSPTFCAVVVARNEEALIQRCLDADEVITAKLGERLRARVAAAGGAAGIWIPRMSCWFGLRLPHIGGYPDHQLRCFRRGAGLYPDRLHSHPEIDGPTLFMPAEEDAWIFHERDGQKIGDLVRKWDEYADKEARAQLRGGGAAPGPLAMIWAAYRFEAEAKRWEAARYRRDADATVRRLGSLPRLAAALIGHGLGRLWARRSAR